jgi:hypothetical protein
MKHTRQSCEGKEENFNETLMPLKKAAASDATQNHIQKLLGPYI